MVVTLDEFLQYTNKEHESRMREVQIKEKMLKDVPYIDNIPL